MRFDTAGKVTEVTWAMRLAEIPRADNRTVLNRLYNGHPPFNEDTAEENGVQINRNFLEGPNLLANGRRQWNRAMLGGGRYFNVNLDSGPAHKRRSWSTIITNKLNRILKSSPDYMEYMRGMGGTAVLHGIAPANYPSRTGPFIEQLDVGDLLIPSQTLVSFKDLDRFAICRQLTPSQLYELALKGKRNPGWNIPMVKAEIAAAAEEYFKGPYSINSQYYQPEKVEEIIKGDVGFWGSDAVPTIDVIDFYFREADDGDGWYRRMVLDSALSKEARTAYLQTGSRPKMREQKEFLYTSNKRKYANSLREIIHCQFADCSAVFPARYHSQRSLGFMLYGVCELQNRLRCKFSEAVFEQMMWFFRTSNEQQFSRLKKALFSHMGVIPEGIEFVTAEQRFKPDANLVELQLSTNRQLLSENAASFTQDFDSSQSREMTATETMARVNSVNALVSGMLALAYEYEKFQYRETCRRFCLKESKHTIVKEFRLACLNEGVPEEMLDSDKWNIEPERVLGGGNKTLEIAQADKLMSVVNRLDPTSQQVVTHMFVEANSDDPALAETLVPLEGQQQVSDATHDAELAAGVLLMGLPMQMKTGLNHVDYTRALLNALITKIKQIEARDNVGTPEEIYGLLNLAGVDLNNQPTSPNGIAAHIQILAQDKEAQEIVKQYSDALGEAMNMIKGFAQRLQEQMQEQAAQNGGIDPKDAAKIQGMMMTSQAKAANTRESHSQRTAQRQVQFEMEQKRKEDEHRIELRREMERQGVEDTAEGLRTAAEIQRENTKAANAPKEEPVNA